MNRLDKPVLACALLLSLTLPAFSLNRADLLPENRKIDLRVSNTATFLESLKKSSIGKLWADPQFQDFLGKPDKDVWMELLGEDDNGAEREMILEQLKMLKGEVILALDSDSDDPYLIAAMSTEDFQRSLMLDEKLAKSVEQPFNIRKSSFQDAEIIQHIEHAGTDRESSTWQANLNGTLVLGPSREWVEKSIVRLKKESMTEPAGNTVLDFNLPLSTLIKEAMEEARKEKAANPAINPSVLFESLGLMGLEKLSMHIELKDDEMVINNNLVATSLDKGIFTILDMEPAGLPTVGFIPENISMLEVGRVNLLRFWQEIPTILSASMPEIKSQFDLIMGMLRQQIGIDLEQDLLAHLGTRYLSFSTLDNDMLITVLALELRDSQAFRNGLETVMNAPIVQPQIALALDTVDFLDHPLYVSKNTEPADTISFSVVGNYLVYGQPDGVRQVIRNASSEATAHPRLEQMEFVQNLRRFTSPNAFGFSAVDWKKNMGFLIRELTKPQTSRKLLEQWATSGAPIPPPDFDKLPPTDHLASFFNMSYLYIEKTNTGLHQQIILKY